MFQLRRIEYNTEEYRGMVKLRDEILRIPFNSICTEKELKEDEHNILLGVFAQDVVKPIGCCLLTATKTAHTVQLRQMAITTLYQAKGLGAQLLAFAEKAANEANYKYVCLHARTTALEFYKKQGYTIEGDEFLEIGLPHFHMIKEVG